MKAVCSELLSASFCRDVRNHMVLCENTRPARQEPRYPVCEGEILDLSSLPSLEYKIFGIHVRNL